MKTSPVVGGRKRSGGPALALAALLCAGSGSAADWPRWRGPNANGVSPEYVSAGWPASGPQVLWRAQAGTGFSSITIADGRVYTMGNSNNTDQVWCYEARTGAVLWRHVYPSRLDPQYYEGGPGATPTIHSNRVFTLSKWGDVWCLDAISGIPVWNVQLAQHGVRSNRWGFAGSPLVWNDLLILNAGSAGLALRWQTGEMAWLSGTNPTGYATPVVLRKKGGDQVLIFAAKHLVALDPRTGRELWRHPFETSYDTNNSDPLPHGDTVFISSFSRGCALLALSEPTPKVVYESKALNNHLSPGILIGDHLYAFHGQAHFTTDFRCVHLPSGRVEWQIKDPNFGSLIQAGDKLVILTEKGHLILTKPSPKGYQELVRARVLDGVCWTPPSLAGGRLYARNARGNVVCLALEAPGQSGSD